MKLTEVKRVIDRIGWQKDRKDPLIEAYAESIYWNSHPNLTICGPHINRSFSHSIASPTIGSIRTYFLTGDRLVV